MLNKSLALLFVVVCVIGLQILVMTQGWGVSAKSWWWIIGGGTFGQAFMKTLGDKVLTPKA